MPDDDRRAAVLDLLRDADEPLSVGQVADSLGVHLNTARYHLENLVRGGRARVVAEPDDGGVRRGRPRRLFRAADGWDPRGPRRYLGLAEALLDHLRAGPDPDADALEAGYRWGRRLAADRRRPRDAEAALRDWLAELDFAPEPRARPDEPGIHLRHCPFADLTEDDGLVCRLHLGMLRGAVDEWRAPLDVVALDVRVEPDRCAVRLGATA